MHLDLVSDLKRAHLPEERKAEEHVLRAGSGFGCAVTAGGRRPGERFGDPNDFHIPCHHHPPNVPIGPRDSEESSTWPAGSVALRPSGGKHENDSTEEEVTVCEKMDGAMYRFRLIDAAYIIGSVITFLADQTTGDLTFNC